MKQVILIVMAIIALQAVSAQQADVMLRKGNKLYKKHQFDKAVPAFQQAVQQNPSNAIASYNLGNGQFRMRNYEEAEKSYDNAAAHAPTSVLREKAYYNKGVTFTKEKKLPESIDAYKEALKLDPTDADARFNLQRALTEKKQQEQQQQPKEEQPKKKQQQQKQQQPQQQSKLSKQKVEQLLKALQQKEQEVQQRMQQNKTRAASQQDKDW